MDFVCNAYAYSLGILRLSVHVRLGLHVVHDVLVYNSDIDMIDGIKGK